MKGGKDESVSGYFELERVRYAFLPSVIRYSKSEEVEVCVADNGSTDASVEMLREEFPCVRIIVLDQNH